MIYKNDEDKIPKILQKYEKETNKIFDEIKNAEDDNKKYALFKQLLEKNDTKEEYILEYLKFMNNYDKNNFKTILYKRQIFISEENYNANFKGKLEDRKPARKKFLDYFDFIRNINLGSEKNKFLFITHILTLAKIEPYISLKTKKEITWDNKELYMNNLYLFLIENIIKVISRYHILKNEEKEDKEEEGEEEDEEQIKEKEKEKKLELEKKEEEKIQVLEKKEEKKIEEYDNNKNEKNKEEKKENMKQEVENNEEEKKKEIEIDIKNKEEDMINDSKNLSLFCQFYVGTLQNFLIATNTNFNIRFKNLELQTNEDKLLFEDFIQFISTYSFDYENIDDYINLWNESFVSLNKKQKMDILSYNVKWNKDIGYEFYYDDKRDELQIKNILSNAEIKINEIDKYVFSCLFPNIMYLGTNKDRIDWVKNKYMKPTFYNKDLFVAKKKNTWRKLIYKILKSNTYVQIKKSLYKNNQINYFEDEDIIKNIIDNIRYVNYKTIYLGNTNNNTLRVYENGIYDKKNINKSISMLIYYGGHIVINIQEIGGHINVKLQNFYPTNSKNKDYPKIIKREKNLYSKYAINKNHKSGESVQIKFFGKVVQDLTIREAIYILTIDNYEKSLEEFRTGFSECNKISIDKLLDNKNLSKLLINLDIEEKEIIRDINNNPYPIYNGAKLKEPIRYPVIGNRHPLSFYENINWLDNFLSYARKNNIQEENILKEFFAHKNQEKNK